MSPKMTGAPLSVLVIGAGAIGTYIGGSLALSGQRITFLEQPGAAEEIARRGLRLDLRAGGRPEHQTAIEISPKRFTISDRLRAGMRQAPFDLAVMALKSFDTAGFLESIKPFQEAFPTVVCLQNGVENEALLAEVLGAERVVSGTVTSSIGRGGPGRIILERLRGMGLADGHKRVAEFTAAFEAAGLKPRLFQNPQDMKWSKMLTNLIGNATSAILDIPPRAIYARRSLHELEMEMLREALMVMKAAGIRAIDLPGTPVRALALAPRLPARLAQPLMVRAVGGGRGGKMPSFHIDLHSGRGRSEVAYLNGAVVRFGERLGVATPVNRLLTETLLALTRGEIPIDHFRGRPDGLLARL